MKGQKILFLKDLSATHSLGDTLSSMLRPGDTLLLKGDLGAGKTTLIKAIAEGLGIDPNAVTSPTFTIIHDYPDARIPFAHADLYRLGPDAEISETGLEEYLSGNYVTAIEWAEYLPGLPDTEWLKIELLHISDTERKAVLEAGGIAWRRRLDSIERSST